MHTNARQDAESCDLGLRDHGPAAGARLAGGQRWAQNSSSTDKYEVEMRLKNQDKLDRLVLHGMTLEEVQAYNAARRPPEQTQVTNISILSI
jgi:hypothetical protein